MQIRPVVFALSGKFNKQKVRENNLLCASNKVFVKYQGQGEVLIPITRLRTPLVGRLGYALPFHSCFQLLVTGPVS